MKCPKCSKEVSQIVYCDGDLQCYECIDKQLVDKWHMRSFEPVITRLYTSPGPQETPESVKLTTLPTDSQERKNIPIFSGCLKYFAAALAGIAKVSKNGNDKHNPGEPLHHARGKSSDHGDCIIRHLMDTADLLAAKERGNTSVTDQQILEEANQMAWRALAFTQELHERLGVAPLAPGAKKAEEK